MSRAEPLTGFPLGQWVERHSGVRHNLALSGMAGESTVVPRLLEAPPASTPERLRTLLATMHAVEPGELFLTHGAHEANHLALAFLAGKARRKGNVLEVRVDPPEYPPLFDIISATGSHRAVRPEDGDVWLLSNPNNPTGHLRSAREVEAARGRASIVLVDEAYREFTAVPSLAGTERERVWVTGTFTKVYGADEIRVGWSIPPRSFTAEYGRFHPLAADKVGKHSVDSAVAILAARPRVLREVRDVFERNRKALRRKVPEAGDLAAPVWFDRGGRGLPGDRLQAAALRRSVLVCSGTFFGDPRGVRVCLTRRSFANDLAHYLAVRQSFLGSSAHE